MSISEDENSLIQSFFKKLKVLRGGNLRNWRIRHEKNAHIYNHLRKVDTGSV